METRNPRHIPARTHSRKGSSTASRRDADFIARILVWAALGWTIAMIIVVLFFATFGQDQTVFERLGPFSLVLGFVPIVIVSLPLFSAVTSRINNITPIVAAITAFLVVCSIIFAGGFFIPSAFALMAAALLELAERG